MESAIWGRPCFSILGPPGLERVKANHFDNNNNKINNNINGNMNNSTNNNLNNDNNVFKRKVFQINSF